MLKKIIVPLFIFIFMVQIYSSSYISAEYGVGRNYWEYCGDLVKFSNFTPKNNTYTNNSEILIQWTYFDNESVGWGEIYEFSISTAYHHNLTYLAFYDYEALNLTTNMMLSDLPTQYKLTFADWGFKINTTIILSFYIKYYYVNRTGGGYRFDLIQTNTSYYIQYFEPPPPVNIVDYYPYIISGLAISGGLVIVYFIYIQQKKKKETKRVFKEVKL